MADEKDIEQETTEAPQEEATETPAAQEKPKRTRKPPAKPKAQADEPAGEADAPAAEDAGEAATPAEKPKRARKTPAPKAKAEPKREAQKPARERPVVRAQARYVRSSARKARMVCPHIQGRSVADARAILQYSPRGIARDWLKLLESAVANAEHNHELDGDDLKIAAAFADEGPTIKRFRPRAQGRATRIRKRTSHLTIKLTPKE